MRQLVDLDDVGDLSTYSPGETLRQKLVEMMEKETKELNVLNEEIKRLEKIEQDRVKEEKKLDELEALQIRSEKLKEIANERLTNARLTTPARGSDLLINQP